MTITNKRQRNRRAERNRIGLCAFCGKEPKRPDRTTCKQCGIYFAEQQRKVRAQRVAQDLCHRCGKNPPRAYPEYLGRPPKYLACDQCVEVERRRSAYNRAKGNTLPQRRRAVGLCITCGNSLDIANRVRCSACLQKNRLKYARSKYGENGAKAMERDRCECQLCGVISHLHAHHIDGKGYDSPEPNNALENLITLCNRCHYGITLLTTRGVNRARAIELLSE